MSKVSSFSLSESRLTGLAVVSFGNETPNQCFIPGSQFCRVLNVPPDKSGKVYIEALGGFGGCKVTPKILGNIVPGDVSKVKTIEQGYTHPPKVKREKREKRLEYNDDGEPLESLLFVKM